jgi:parallel beta-helix repeat protein
MNTVVAGNRCPLGGGIFTSSSPQIINCTIQGNSGPGIQLTGASAAPILRNTIVWGNRTGEGPPFSYQQIRNEIGLNAADVDFSLVEGLPSSLANLDGSLDPKFVRSVDPNTSPNASADLRVFIDSPVLNVGNNGSAPTLLGGYDRAGKPRVQDATIDLGAYEGGYVTFGFLHTPLDPTEDSNGNGITNFGDYAAGGNPTTPDDPSLRPTLSGNQLTFSFRDNAADITKEFQKSTTLLPGSWTMIQASDYTSSTTTSSGGRSLQTLTLGSTLLNTNPKLFFREEFKSVP